MPTAEALVTVMMAKLYHAKNAFEGLVAQDWPTVEHEATALAEMSKRADWFVHPTEAYYGLSNDFRTRALALADAARGGEVQPALDAYADLTASCLNCHRYLQQAGLYVPGRLARRASHGDDAERALDWLADPAGG